MSYEMLTSSITADQLESIVRRVVQEQLARLDTQPPKLVAHTSARHLHLCQEDLEKLFGSDAKLTVFRPLYQPGEFASEQTVTLVGPRQRAIESVRILGPLRKHTQVEVSATDSLALGLKPPVRPSGQIDGTPGCIIVGPKGAVELKQGVIRAERHVHMSDKDAEYYGFLDGQYVRLRVTSESSITFEKVLCRVNPKFLLEVHLDTDEGNACSLSNATGIELLP